ncbi:MAG: hypothetical protein JO021_13995 [Alphaproteobacteria bacterium]|nr:hypothetical protein [Alphaproteobacteria bacterium]
MTLDDILQGLEATALAEAIRENEVLFPWIESVHVIAIVLVVGTISIVDLRLLGVASLDRAVGRLMRELLPYTWSAFAVAALTGSLLFVSNAMTYGHNVFFRGKLILLVAAGLNMALFHLVTGRGSARWGAAARPPLSVRTTGAVSLGLWISIIGFGRWIGFTLH